MKANSAGSQNRIVGCSPLPSRNHRLHHILRQRKTDLDYDLRQAIESAHAVFFAKRSISIRSLR